MPEIAARQLLLFAHVLAFALAMASLLRADLALFHARTIDPAKLARTARRMKRLLASLWLTGAGLVLLEARGEIALLLAMAAQPKLAAKLVIVCLLTLNGLLLHRYVFPAMGAKHARAERVATACVCLGAVSSASWLAASFVGTARIAGPHLSYADFLALYLAAVAVAVVFALVAAQPRLARLLRP